MALIELDLTAQPGPAPASIPPARRYRTAGLVLAAVLLLVLGGAAAPDAPRWQFLGAVPSPPMPESPFQLDGDQIFTAGGLGDARTVSAWDVRKPPHRRWSVRIPAREIGPDQVAYGDVRARPAGDVVLITDGPQTTAVDGRTGAVRWHTDIAVHALSGGRFGLVQDPKFRPGTDYNQSGGAPGDLYFSAAGVPHDEPPVTTELRGVDLDTGATAWTASAPGSVVFFDDPAGVLVLASNRLTLLAATTGAVLRTMPLPPLDGQVPESGRLVGGLLLVAYGQERGDGSSLVAFSTRTFQLRWRVPQAKLVVDSGACVDLVCADEQSGVSVLDPATGRALWQAPGSTLVGIGDDVLQQDTGTTDAVRVADRRNGDEKLPLRGWESDISAADGSPLLLRRTEASGASLFAVVQDDPVALRTLGATHGPVSDCAADASFVVCRGAGVLQVFSYHG